MVQWLSSHVTYTFRKPIATCPTTVFYQRLNRDPIQDYQKIVKDTVNDMIATCALPPTAQRLVVTTPRTSQFYMLPRYTNQTTRGAQLFPLAVALQRTSQFISTRQWLHLLQSTRFTHKRSTSNIHRLVHSSKNLAILRTLDFTFETLISLFEIFHGRS